jgi:hypothetical protein
MAIFQQSTSGQWFDGLGTPLRVSEACLLPKLLTLQDETLPAEHI